MSDFNEDRDQETIDFLGSTGRHSDKNRKEASSKKEEALYDVNNSGIRSRFSKSASENNTSSQHKKENVRASRNSGRMVGNDFSENPVENMGIRSRQQYYNQMNSIKRVTDVDIEADDTDNEELRRLEERRRARKAARQNGSVRSQNTNEKSSGSDGRNTNVVRRVRRSTQGSSKNSGNGFGINIKPVIFLILLIIIIILLIFGIVAGVRKSSAKKAEESSAALASEEASIAESEEESESEALASSDNLAKAELMAAQYDYDGAIELIKSMPEYADSTELQSKVSEYEETKSTLVEQDLYKITHIFFHILCVDPENAFDESKWGTQAGGYNSLMTTIDEFEKMIQELYDKGYVLVSLHDLAHEEVQEDGTTKMVKSSIMLPPDKKAFVMSEDDVCYYEYMEGAGFADKMVIGDDGRPTNHYTDKDGNEFVGDYDLVPILDKFIDEHPDFSYKGHKACLVFTGYNGVLGYRTDESYDPDSEYYDSSLEQGHDVEAERKEAVEVMKALYEDGYDLGSHSWGHRDLGEIDMERFKKDCDRWNRNVASLIKEATGSQPDIIIFPKGADIGDWHPYASDNERFKYMYNLGFRYYCNVDNNQYWVQLGDTYLRQGRRALDGLNMWLQISGQNDRLSDLFDDVNAIFDKARPTPVPNY